MRSQQYVSVTRIADRLTNVNLDILTAVKRTAIPKPHDLSFCFIATASAHKDFYGLTFAPQTIPASPAVLMYRVPNPFF
jgi:hypothetical protein